MKTREELVKAVDDARVVWTAAAYAAAYNAAALIAYDKENT
jgi:hypothetical protein